MSDRAPLGLEDVITFGKWEGTTVEHVLTENSDYLRWMLKRTQWKFTEEVMQKLGEK